MFAIPSPGRVRSVTILATTAAVLLGLLAAFSPTPARAAPGDLRESPTEDVDCVGTLGCIVFAPWSGDEGGFVPTQEAWNLVPLPEDIAHDDWEGSGPGWYLLQQAGSSDSSDDPGMCLKVVPGGSTPEGDWEEVRDVADASVGLGSCDKNHNQTAVRFEPVGQGANRTVDAESWDPWTSNTDDAPRDDAFQLRTVHTKKSYRCIAPAPEADSWDLFGAVPCESGDRSTAVKIHRVTDDHDPGHKDEATRKSVTAHVLSAAADNAMAECRQEDDDGASEYTSHCVVRAVDPDTENALSVWTNPGSEDSSIRLGSLTDQISTEASRCAAGSGGSGAETFYNGGSAPVSTTIGVSTTSTVSESVNASVSVTTSFGGSLFGLIEASGSITVSAGYGKTWSDSTTSSQEMAWTVPPRRWATGVLTTTSVGLGSSWRFGPAADDPWILNNATLSQVPYSEDSSAQTPDASLMVYNSWQRKDCDANTPSTLADGHQIGVENVEADGKAPIVGDELRAEVAADRAWWSYAATDPTPVSLRYQWYRVRGDEAPTPIPGARSRTYTVTGDDVTDPEVLDRFGAYHIFVGVTDVAGARRFDSLEYTSVATGGVTEGPRRVAEGNLDLEIANPDTVATKDTRVDLAASITDGDGPVDGEVTLLDGEEELTTVSLGSDGTKRVWLPLTAGPHDLTAVFEGGDPLDGVRSSTVRTTVTAAPSTPELTARRTVTVDEEATLRADVTGAGPTPTGTVEFHDGPDSLGDPVTLDADGAATLDVPGLGVGGSRDVWVSYSGDDIYAGSQSEQTRQTAARAATRTRVKVPNLPTARGERTRLKGRVLAAGSDVPSGKIVFFADGRRVGAGQVNARGVAKMRTRKLARGKSDVWARFVPRSGSPFAASRSRASTHQVRRHESRVRGQLRDKRVRKRERVQVRGRVVLPDKRRVRRLRGKIWIAYDGRRYGLKRINRNGAFRVGMPARRLDKGRNRIKVVYRGSKRPSVAADTKRVIVRRR